MQGAAAVGIQGDPAEPLPIDDRTALLLLEAIQTFESRTLSYRALDVEQIGHVYEGLLERTVKRVNDVTLELDSGAKAKSPRVTLGEMESARLDGTARVAELLKERSERSESAIRNALERAADDQLAARLLTVCRGDVNLRDRILPYPKIHVAETVPVAASPSFLPVESMLPISFRRVPEKPWVADTMRHPRYSVLCRADDGHKGEGIQPSVASIRPMAAADGARGTGHPDRQFLTCAQAELALRADAALAVFISWPAQ